MNAQATLKSSDNSNANVLYMAFELSASTWKLALSDGRPRARIVNVPAGDLKRLKEEIEKAQKRFCLENSRVVSCFEAGRDGFWLHRFLRSVGVENVVVDSASIEVNRRYRRLKTDRLDAEKLLSQLLRYHQGEQRVWSVIHVPSVEAEDMRHLDRELSQLKSEIRQHRMRIGSLLVTLGINISVNQSFLNILPVLKQWDGRAIPPFLEKRLKREYARLQAARAQKRELESERAALLEGPVTKAAEQVQQLHALRGIGSGGAWSLVLEFFGWRHFDNRKQLGSAAGLTPTLYASGRFNVEQGISKAGNPRVRWMMVQLAWGWLRYQPDSALTRWYQQRFGEDARQRRKGIVALARRLLIALWRYLEQGVVPDGAIFKPTEV